MTIKPIQSGKAYSIALFGIPYKTQVISATANNIKFYLLRAGRKPEIRNVRPSIFRMWMSAVGKVKSSRKYMLNPKRKTKSRFAKEIKKFKDFSGRLNANVTRRNITWPTKLIHLGKATDVTYRSDKQVGTLPGGVMRDYIHDLKKHGEIYTNSDGTMIIILGTKINLKKEGIVG